MSLIENCVHCSLFSFDMLVYHRKIVNEWLQKQGRQNDSSIILEWRRNHDNMQKRDVTWIASAKVVSDLLQSAAFVKPEWKFSRKMVGRASSSSSFFYYVYNPNQCLTFEAVQKFDRKILNRGRWIIHWVKNVRKNVTCCDICPFLWGVLNMTFRSV